MSAADAKHASNTVSKTISKFRSERSTRPFGHKLQQELLNWVIRTLSATILQTPKAF